MSLTLNLFFEAHWLYSWSFFEEGTPQPLSSPTSNSEHIAVNKWREEKKTEKATTFQIPTKRVAIVSRERERAMLLGGSDMGYLNWT